jgi:hypothetical protein
MPRGEKLFLHLGAHKTATTFIQHNLRANQKLFMASGWQFVHMKWHHPDVHNSVVRRRKKNPTELPRRHGRLIKMFTDLSESDRNILFTSEDLLGSMTIKSGQIYPAHELNIQRLRESIPAAVKPTVAFSIRDFGGFIESTYNWFVARGMTDSIENYTSAVDPSTVSWRGTVRCLVDTFGEENVRIWTYEDFKTAPNAYIKYLVDLAGIEIESPLKIPRSAPMNVSYAANTIPVAVELNRALETMDFTKDDKQDFRAKMRGLLAELPLPDKRASLLPEALRSALSDRYEKEVAEMRAKWPSVFVRLQPEPAPATNKATATP